MNTFYRPGGRNTIKLPLSRSFRSTLVQQNFIQLLLLHHAEKQLHSVFIFNNKKYKLMNKKKLPKTQMITPVILFLNYKIFSQFLQILLNKLILQL